MDKKHRLKTRILILSLALFLLMPVVFSTTAYADGVSITDGGDEIMNDDDAGSLSEDADNGIVGPVADSAMEWGADGADSAIQGATSILNIDFAPSFFTLMDLEHGNSIYGSNSTTYDKETIMQGKFFTVIWKTAALIGMALASILFLFNMFLCVCGQAQQIKDSPLRLFGRYCVVVILINISDELIYQFVQLMSNIWTGFIAVSSDGTLITASTLGLNFDFATILAGTLAIGTLTIVCPAASIILVVILLIIVVVIAWKILKGVLHLYLEIVQRYFIFMILTLLMPAAFATFTSHWTNNILHSYFRMLCSQVFIMVLDMAFMKVFISVGAGWTAGVGNLIACFAFLKVASRFDSYLAAMGINIGQTGGALGQSVGGSIRNGLGLLSSVFGNGSRVAGAAGRHIAANGLNTGDFNTWSKGMSMQGKTPTVADMAKFSRDAFGPGSGAPAGGGSYSFQPGGGGFYDSLHANGLDTSIPKKLERAGIDTSRIAGMEVSNGNYRFLDSDGNAVASMNKNMRVYDAAKSDYISDGGTAATTANSAADTADYNKDVYTMAKGMYDDTETPFDALPAEEQDRYRAEAMDDVTAEFGEKPEVTPEEEAAVADYDRYNQELDDAAKDLYDETNSEHDINPWDNLDDDTKNQYRDDVRDDFETENGNAMTGERYTQPDVPQETVDAVHQAEAFDKELNAAAKDRYDDERSHDGGKPSFDDAPDNIKNSYMEKADKAVSANWEAEGKSKPDTAKSVPNIEPSEFNGESGLNECRWDEKLHSTGTAGHYTGKCKGVNVDTGKTETFEVEVWDAVQHPEMTTKADMPGNIDEYRNKGNMVIRRHSASSQSKSQEGRTKAAITREKKAVNSYNSDDPHKGSGNSRNDNRNSKKGKNGRR